LNTTAIGEILAALLVLTGSLVSLLSAVGVFRFPDVYNRSHAASKSSALGVLFILLGTFLYFGLARGMLSVRLLLVIFFVFMTAPLSAHLVCRSAHRSGVKLAGDNPRDDLQEVIGLDDA